MFYLVVNADNFVEVDRSYHRYNKLLDLYKVEDRI